MKIRFADPITVEDFAALSQPGDVAYFDECGARRELQFIQRNTKGRYIFLYSGVMHVGASGDQVIYLTAELTD